MVFFLLFAPKSHVWLCVKVQIKLISWCSRVEVLVWGCHVWGQVTWGWSSVVDVLQGQKGIGVSSSCAGQCCAAVRLKHKRQEWKVVSWEHPMLLQDWGAQSKPKSLRPSWIRGEEKKKKKSVSRIYYSWQLVTTFLLHCLMTPRHFTPLLPFPEFPVSYWCLVVHRQGSKEPWFKADGLFLKHIWLQFFFNTVQ